MPSAAEKEPGEIAVITRADDMGVAHSANRAIVEACLTGTARNVSVLACAPFFDEAAEMLRDLDGIDIGVHYCLNAEWDNIRWGSVLPPEKARTLLDEHGHFHKTPHELHARNPAREEMLAEAKAQIARMRACGLRPAYLDTHMGVDWVGDITADLQRICAEEGLLFAPPLGSRMPTPLGPAIDDTLERYLAQLRHIGPGLYLCIGHPMYDDEEARAFSLAGSTAGVVSRDRDQQRQMFTSPAVRHIAAERGIRFMRYSEAAALSGA